MSNITVLIADQRMSADVASFLRQRGFQVVAQGAHGPEAVSAAKAKFDPRQKIKSPLTHRQIQVLQLIAFSHPNKQIADQLGISIKTVSIHRQALMDKLGIHDAAGLTRYAIDSSLASGKL